MTCTRPHLPLALAFAVVVLATALAPAGAQDGGTDPLVERGFSADRSYQFGGVDSVDLSTGTVSLAIPIGPRYPVGGSFSYGLTLTYDSSIWDFAGYVDGDGHSRTKAYLTKHSNAGQGWRLSLGGLLDPADEDNPQPGKWVFVSSDAAQHAFKTELHNNEPDDPITWYTRDGTYLRLRPCVDPDDPGDPTADHQCVGMPNGVVYTFAPQPHDRWRLKRIEDPFGNWVKVAYDDVAHTETISDSQDRSHEIQYTAFTIDGETRYYVDKALLMTFGDSAPSRSAVFELDYSELNLPRSTKDDSPLTPDTARAALLSSLHLPEVPGNEPTDAGRYGFGYCTSLVDPSFDGVKDAPGMLKSLRYPTGGSIEWTYQTWTYSAAIDDPYSPHPWDVLTISMEWAGVKSKTLWDRAYTDSGAVEIGTWRYWTELVRPGPTYGGVPEERITIVTSPEGDDTAHYFRAMPRDIGGLDDDVTEAWSYGLPFTMRVTDPIAEDNQDLYLSVEYYDGAATVDLQNPPDIVSGTKIRSQYVRYEHDEFKPLLDDSSYRNVHRYRQAAMTVYHDDLVDGGIGRDEVERWKAVYRSDFDGLGHYRTTETDGNFPGQNVRTTTTSFNPDSGTYPGSFTLPDTTSPWILGTFDVKEQTVGASTARQDLCFDEDGALLRKRVIAADFVDGSSRSAHDIVVTYEYDDDGALTAERHYGADLQDVGTSPELCTMALPAIAYSKVTHTWSHGALETTQQYDWLEDVLGNQTFDPLPHLSVHREVDPATGLTRREYDTTGLYVDYEYDARLRPTWEKPQTGLTEGNDAWVQYEYVPFTVDGVGPEVEVYLRPNGSDTATLARKGYEYDPLGRLVHERRLQPAGTWSGRTTTLNAQGWVLSTSEWGTTDHGTSYSDFDPFGRPGTITLADGSVITKAFTGESRVEETTQVFLHNDGSPLEGPVSVTQTFDQLGRAFRTEEMSTDPPGTVTQYAYDVGGRLSRVTTAIQGASQHRWFTYDNRGFLLSEQFPETGAGGNGAVVYSDYDVLGNAGKRTEGSSELLTRYDHAGRILGVDAETSCGIEVPLTWYTYGTQNTPGNRALGKLTSTTSLNYYDGVEGYCDGTKMSGGIFSDGFEDGTTTAWSMTFTTDQSLLVRRTWTYGGRAGRISGLQTTIGDDLFSQTFAWDDLGSVTQLGYPDLAGFAEPPAALGTVTNTYTDGLLTAVGGFASSLTYHPNGAVNTVFHTNGVHDVHWMDGSSMQRPARIRARRSGAFPWDPGAYGFDGAGNVTSIGAQTFTYDEGNRLVQSQADDGSGLVTQTYGYDGFGNLVSITDSNGTRTFPADLATNRLAAAAYDAAGNLTSWGGFSYQWRPTGELRTRTGTGLNKWFAYDAGGERVVVHDRLSGRMTFTIRDLGGKVLRVFGKDAGGSWSWEKDYVHRNGLLLAAKDPAGTVHFTLDHLGTPRYVTDAAGNEVARHGYFGFGEEATAAWRDEAMKFTGHERDLEGTPDRLDDLDYMHARYYNPLLGRFLSVDPVGGAVESAQSWNRYSYVRNNPLRLVDPSGMAEAIVECMVGEQCTGGADLKFDLQLEADAAEARVILAHATAVATTPNTADEINAHVDTVMAGRAESVKLGSAFSLGLTYEGAGRGTGPSLAGSVFLNCAYSSAEGHSFSITSETAQGSTIGTGSSALSGEFRFIGIGVNNVSDLASGTYHSGGVDGPLAAGEVILTSGGRLVGFNLGLEAPVLNIGVVNIYERTSQQTNVLWSYP